MYIVYTHIYNTCVYLKSVYLTLYNLFLRRKTKITLCIKVILGDTGWLSDTEYLSHIWVTPTCYFQRSRASKKWFLKTISMALKLWTKALWSNFLLNSIWLIRTHSPGSFWLRNSSSNSHGSSPCSNLRITSGLGMEYPVNEKWDKLDEF